MTVYSDPYAVQEAKRNREKSDWPHHKNLLLQMLWNHGYKPYEIAEQIGVVSAGAVIAQATRLRNQGWDIHWRNKEARVR